MKGYVLGEIKYSPKVTRVNRQLGAQIKRSRLARKLSQELIAERARLSLSSLQRMEKGDPAVAMGSYLMVLLALGILPDSLGIADNLGDELLEMDERLRAPKAIR
jgi:transcriptional regulator with XRE-family HTH domain